MPDCSTSPVDRNQCYVADIHCQSPTSSEADASYIYSPDRQELTDASSEQGQTAASTDSLPQQEEEVTERRASVSGKPKLVDVASPRRLSRPVSRITHCKASSADSRSSSTEQQLIDGQAEEGMQGNIGGISGIE